MPTPERGGGFLDVGPRPQYKGIRFSSRREFPYSFAGLGAYAASARDLPRISARGGRPRAQRIPGASRKPPRVSKASGEASGRTGEEEEDITREHDGARKRTNEGMQIMNTC